MIQFPKIKADIFVENAPLEGLLCEWSTSMSLAPSIWESNGWPELTQAYFAAVQAELVGQANRADFYWQKVPGNYRKVRVEESMRQAFVKDVLVASHLALAKGYEEVPGQDQNFFQRRKQYHLDHAWKWVLKLPVEQFGELHEQLARDRANRLVEYKKSAEAEKFMTERIVQSAYPIYWQGRLFRYLKEKAEQEIGQVSTNLNQQHVLKSAVDRLEKFRGKFNNYFPAYPVISSLTYAMAVTQANNQELAPALRDLRKAQAYWPANPDWEETWKQVSEMMEQQQAHIRHILANMPYNANLNADGQKMKKDADKGFTLVTQFSKGAEQFLIDKRETAYATFRLYELGLDEMAEEQEPEQAIKEFGILLQRYYYKKDKSPAVNREVLEAIWPKENAVAAYPLETIWPRIEERAIGQAAVIIPEEINLNWVESNLQPPVDAKGAGGEPPFKEWLLSWANWPTKVAAAAAVILLCLVSVQSLKQAQTRQVRDAAFTEIQGLFEQKTNGEGENAALLASLAPAIERFVDHPPPYGEDLRIRQIATAFDEAFSDWFFAAESYEQADFDYYAAIYQKLKKYQ